MAQLFEVLVADDNPTDLLIIEEALGSSQVTTRTHATRDGLEALAFLRRQGPAFAAAPRPNLILLDVHMPGKGGLAALAEIKADPALQDIPVIMLSSSRSEADVAAAYTSQANGYVVKPIGFDDFMAVLGSIEAFWAGTVRLPGAVMA